MNRIKLVGISQKAFFDKVVAALSAPSLRGLLQFGLNVQYSALKNYYNDIRLLPQDLFDDIVSLTDLEVEHEVVPASWGQKLGGRKSKRKR